MVHDSLQVVVRRRMRRDTVVAFCSKYPGSIVAMEVCCGAHHIGRDLASRRHEIRLMSPEDVRPYVKAQKNDDRDAEAIAEAATRANLNVLHGINTTGRVPGFADGGLVGGAVVDGGSAGGDTHLHTHVHIDGASGDAHVVGLATKAASAVLTHPKSVQFMQCALGRGDDLTIRGSHEA